MERHQSDQRIMEKLYELYEQKMFMVAYSILKDYQQAEDAVHEAFIKLSKHLSKLKDVSCEKSRRYVLMTIKGVSIDLYRKNQADSLHCFQTEADKLVQIADKHSISETLQVENEMYIEQLLRKLSPIYKEVVLDYYYRQLSICEIAHNLTISEDAARKRLQRAVASLKQMVGDEFV